MNIATCVSVLLPVLAIGSTPAQVISSAFGASAEGWVVVGSAYSGHISTPGVPNQAPAWDAGNGQPPGSLRVGDVYGETAVAAPMPFLGDRLPWFGGSVRWDLFLRFSDNTPYPAIWLIGATKTLSFNLPSPAIGVWQTLTVPLLEAGWRVNSWQGPAATRSDLMQVLGDLRGIYFNTEWHSGADDTNFDNATLSPPATGVVTYGGSCIGSNGKWANLFVPGTITASAATQIELRDAPANAIAVVVVGTGPLALPAFGCTVSIAPSAASVVLLADAAGQATLPLGIPAVPPGPLGWLQAVCLDAAAPSGAGLTLTNGVALTVQ